MKRYMVILVLFVMFLSVSHAVNAQDSKQIITKQITVILLQNINASISQDL